MSVFFTDHAKQRMAERGIAEWQVRETIVKPSRVRFKEVPRVRILQKEFGRHTLEVVVGISGMHARVITVYWV